jgi:hypothetical protein
MSRARSSNKATAAIWSTVEDGEVELVRQRADGTEEALAALGPGR